MSETRAITEDERKDFAFGDLDDYWVLVKDEIIDQTRWSTHFVKVWHDTRDDTYWRFGYSLGSTEQQYGSEEFDDGLTRVYPHVVQRTEYKRKPPSKE